MLFFSSFRMKKRPLAPQSSLRFVHLKEHKNLQKTKILQNSLSVMRQSNGVFFYTLI